MVWCLRVRTDDLWHSLEPFGSGKTTNSSSQTEHKQAIVAKDLPQRLASATWVSCLACDDSENWLVRDTVPEVSSCAGTHGVLATTGVWGKRALYQHVSCRVNEEHEHNDDWVSNTGNHLRGRQGMQLSACPGFAQHLTPICCRSCQWGRSLVYTTGA